MGLVSIILLPVAVRRISLLTGILYLDDDIVVRSLYSDPVAAMHCCRAGILCIGVQHRILGLRCVITTFHCLSTPKWLQLY